MRRRRLPHAPICRSIHLRSLPHTPSALDIRRRTVSSPSTFNTPCDEHTFDHHRRPLSAGRAQTHRVAPPDRPHTGGAVLRDTPSDPGRAARQHARRVRRRSGSMGLTNLHTQCWQVYIRDTPHDYNRSAGSSPPHPVTSMRLLPLRTCGVSTTNDDYDDLPRPVLPSPRPPTQGVSRDGPTHPHAHARVSGPHRRSRRFPPRP